MSLFRKASYASTVVALGFSLLGCDTKAGSGALIGGAGGALVGGVIGSKSHARAGEGALIGGAAGAIGGGLIGNGMDEADKKEARQREYDYDRTASSNGAPWEKRVTKRDVELWTEQGLRDDIIIDRIGRSGTVFHLTASDQNDLRDRGVSESVIEVMRDTERR
jgi:hypothetical protein